MESIRSEVGQVRELTKLFFRRFLDNDLIALDGDTRSTLVGILTLLAAPGIFFPVLELLAYSFGYPRPFPVRDLGSMTEKSMYLSFSMTMLGIATVLEWDTLLPDQRDYTVLRPFPVGLRTILAAKIASLAGFWAVLTVLMNAFPSFAFPSVIVEKEGFRMLGWFIRCHILAVLAGNTFIFLALISVQGLLLNLLGWRGYRRVSPYAQTLLVAALLMMFFTAPALTGQVQPGKPVTRTLLFFPPAWFLGLYEKELGWPQAVFRDLAARALLANGIAAVTALAAFALGYKRHVQRSFELVEGAGRTPGLLPRTLTASANRIWLRRPVERASFHFVSRTLLRNRSHRALLGACLGVGLALVAQSVAGAVVSGRTAWWRDPRGVLMPASLVLSFFLLCGMRYVFTVPAELRANWIFRASGRNDAREYMPGIRKAFFLLGICPLFAVLLPAYAVAWGWEAACFHIAFGLTVSYLLMEALLFGFTKVPFACSYASGKANVKTFWWVYVMAFLLYLSIFTGLEHQSAGHPRRIIWLFALAAVCKMWIYQHNRHLPDEDFALVFDDHLDPAVRALNLLEPLEA